VYLPFLEDHATATVYFHKTNTYLGFVTGRTLRELSKDNLVKTSVYLDLKQSSFAKTFLDIKDMKTSRLKIENQFSNIKAEYRDRIQYLGNESIKLFKVESAGKELQPALYLYMFTMADYEKEFIYLVAERHHIDVTINKKIVKSASLQIATPEALEDLRGIVKFYNGYEEEEQKSKPRKSNKNIMDDILSSNEPSVEAFNKSHGGNGLNQLLGEDAKDIKTRKL
jgi:hypothetical protein